MGLAAIALAVFFLLRRRQRQRAAAANDNSNNDAMSPGTAVSEQAGWPKEAYGSPTATEQSASPYHQMSPPPQQHELHNQYTAELANTQYQELPGSYHGHEMRG